MALDVGTDSYVSVEDANAYWTKNPGGSNWDSASESEKEGALRMATQYIDKQYRWIGVHPGGSDQLLSWPRSSAVDKQGRTRTGIPQELKDATAYLADKVLGEPVLEPKARGGAIQSVQAGSVAVQFSESASAHTSYKYVDLLLSDISTGGGQSVRLAKV